MDHQISIGICLPYIPICVWTVPIHGINKARAISCLPVGKLFHIRIPANFRALLARAHFENEYSSSVFIIGVLLSQVPVLLLYQKAQLIHRQRTKGGQSL